MGEHGVRVLGDGAGEPRGTGARVGPRGPHVRSVPGSGPGAVNVGGVRERDVIVDPGAPSGSLLYRLSYGMTGGYVRSMEDARADDEAIAAAEAAAAEAAARALATGTWGGGGVDGRGWRVFRVVSPGENREGGDVKNKQDRAARADAHFRVNVKTLRLRYISTTTGSGRQCFLRLVDSFFHRCRPPSCRLCFLPSVFACSS